MKKKVVLVISSLQGNGAERFVLTLAKGLQGYGCEAHIVYFRNKIDLPIPNAVKLHYFNYNKFKIIPKFMRQKFIAPYLDKFILNNIGKADLILSNLYPIDGVLAHSQLNNVHLVIHNTTSQEYVGKLNPKFINLLKRIYLQKPCVGVSEGVTQDFKQLFGEQSQITTIYNPIDVDEVRKTADEYVPAYQDYIVHVGKFKQQKRHDILIRAYAKANVSQKLVLVGTGGLMEASKQLVKDLNIDKLVRIKAVGDSRPEVIPMEGGMVGVSEATLTADKNKKNQYQFKVTAATSVEARIPQINVPVYFNDNGKNLISFDPSFTMIAQQMDNQPNNWNQDVTKNAIMGNWTTYEPDYFLQIKNKNNLLVQNNNGVEETSNFVINGQKGIFNGYYKGISSGYVIGYTSDNKTLNQDLSNYEGINGFAVLSPNGQYALEYDIDHAYPYKQASLLFK